MQKSTKEIVFQVAGILILLSALSYFFVPTVAPWIMVFSVAVFTSIIATTPYPGKSIRGKRLFNFQIFGCLLMVVSTYLMFRQRNEWALLMIIAAVFFLYASIVIPKELEKEKNER